MIRSLCNNIEYDKYNYDLYDYVMDPKITELSKSDNLEEFKINLKKNISIDYETIINNLDKIKQLKNNDKFYFYNNEFHIHTNYIGVWGISVYRQVVGYSRTSSFNDLEYFLTKIELFLRRCYRLGYNNWASIPSTKIKILIYKFKNCKRGLNILKETYKDDNNIINNIDKLLININILNNY
jgi:hypothetical protein